MARGLACACALLAIAAGCAKPPLMRKPSLKVTLTATRDCNNCGKATGYPLTYRVLQVTDGSLMAGMALTQIWDKEEKLLGPALLKKSEAFIDPGATKELSAERDPKARAMVIVGNFCRTRGSCWFVVQPFSEGGSVKLTAGPNCFERSKN